MRCQQKLPLMSSLACRPPRTQVLAAAGAVDHDDLVRKASDAFGTVPNEDASSSVQTLIRKVRKVDKLVCSLGVRGAWYGA